MLEKDNISIVIKLLSKEYHQASSMLNFNTPFELLIATILSAQCTDERVNKVTSELFKDYNTPAKIIELGGNGLKKIIRSCGLSNTKSKNIISTCEMLINEYYGEVPEFKEVLVKLPGVGRKTANVVISNAFGKNAIAVDTHVFRVSNRIGLAQAKDVINTEKQLMCNIPEELWSKAHHWLIYHGREICKARNPKCNNCIINSYCEYFKTEVKTNEA
ncbi:MAG: endonuclease III [Eubacteriaceae bacterium]